MSKPIDFTPSAVIGPRASPRRGRPIVPHSKKTHPDWRAFTHVTEKRVHADASTLFIKMKLGDSLPAGVRDMLTNLIVAEWVERNGLPSNVTARPVVDAPEAKISPVTPLPFPASGSRHDEVDRHPKPALSFAGGCQMFCTASTVTLPGPRREAANDTGKG